jgi:D-alanine transaminase
MADALPTCLLNGALVPTAAARISPLDRGFLLGDGVYEVVPCYGGRPFRLQAHFDRLQAGLDALAIPNPHSRPRWVELLQALIAANGGGDMGLYLEITRGAGPGRDFLPQPGLTPTAFAFCWPLATARSGQLERGIAAVTLQDIRWLRCDIKSIALLGPVMLRMEAERRGADEAILVREERLAEGSSSAVFVVNDGCIATPPASHQRFRALPAWSWVMCSSRSGCRWKCAKCVAMSSTRPTKSGSRAQRARWCPLPGSTAARWARESPAPSGAGSSTNSRQ